MQLLVGWPPRPKMFGKYLQSFSLFACLHRGLRMVARGNAFWQALHHLVMQLRKGRLLLAIPQQPQLLVQRWPGSLENGGDVFGFLGDSCIQDFESIGVQGGPQPKPSSLATGNTARLTEGGASCESHPHSLEETYAVQINPEGSLEKKDEKS